MTYRYLLLFFIPFLFMLSCRINESSNDGKQQQAQDSTLTYAWAFGGMELDTVIVDTVLKIKFHVQTYSDTTKLLCIPLTYQFDSIIYDSCYYNRNTRVCAISPDNEIIDNLVLTNKIFHDCLLIDETNLKEYGNSEYPGVDEVYTGHGIKLGYSFIIPFTDVGKPVGVEIAYDISLKKLKYEIRCN